MAKTKLPAAELSETATASTGEDANSKLHRIVERRSFLKTAGIAGATLAASGMLVVNLGGQEPSTQEGPEERSGSLTKGDAAILRFLAAAEIIESDLWLQYQEIGGIQDDEVSKLASQLIPGYPAQPTGGNPLYMQDLIPLDSDMSQYIHDNTEDELSHEFFINKYLASKGADTVTLDKFRTLPSSKATGANQFGRLTNLMQLTVDTSWWTRYRSSTANPDFGDTFAPAIPSLAVNQHPAIPRTDNDANDPNFFQAIVNTAGFHFAFIEQGGTSLYPSLAQRVSSVEVLRILLSIGGTEICHFQTWHDKAGNAPQLSAVDPVRCAGEFPPADWRAPAAKPDHAGTNCIPQQTVSGMFDHSSHEHPGSSHGRGQGPDGGRAVHRPVGGVFRVPAGPGGRRRRSRPRTLTARLDYAYETR
jgi:hypothetical protein